MGQKPFDRAFLQEIMNGHAECGFNTTTLAKRLGKPRPTVQGQVDAAKAAGLRPHEAVAPRTPQDQTIESLRGELERVKLDLAQATRPRFTIRQDFMKQSGKIRILGIGDAHDDPTIPDKTRFEIAGKFAKDLGVDVVLSIGDFLNVNSLCFHIPDETYNGRTKPTFMSDIESGKTAFDALNAGLGSHVPEKHLTLGNHENRLYRMEDQVPASWGMYHSLFDEMVRGAGFSYSPYGAFTFYGGVGATHVPKSVMDKPMGGKNPGPTIGNNSVFDVIYGHTHVHDEHTSRKIDQRHITVLNLACFLPFGHVEDFAKHTPGGWGWGLNDIIIQHGKIQSAKFHPPNELEERYGKA